MPDILGEIQTVAIIPAYNEQYRIGNVARAALNAELVDAVIVVNDGSTDGTSTAVEEAVIDSPTTSIFLLVEHSVNRGKTEALRSGIGYAKALGKQALKTVVFLDADSSPIWIRETVENMKLWQRLVHSRFGTSQQLLAPELIQKRSEYFISLFSEYIDEMVEPVAAGRLITKAGLYQRTDLLDEIRKYRKGSAHAGNRAIPIELWDNMMGMYDKSGLQIDRWGIEGAMNAYIEYLEHAGSKSDQEDFLMYGVVNVGSRVKAGGFLHGIKRMAEIHYQALRAARKFRSANADQ